MLVIQLTSVFTVEHHFYDACAGYVRHVTHDEIADEVG
jgi:hypothetical protein